MKIMLAFPPQFDPTMPNLALPCLTSALKQAGHEVVQKDLNVEAYEFLLSKREVETAAAKIRANYQSLLFLGIDRGELDQLLAIQSFLSGAVENAKGAIRRGRDFYDYQRYLGHLKVMSDSLKLISLAYYGSLLTFESYQMFYSPYSTEQVLKAIREPDCNLYHDFYSREVIPRIIREAPPVLGISITIPWQVIPGLTLAYLVKQALKNVHIVIGGNYFTLQKERLVKNPVFFSFIDSVVVYEGEAALVKLLDCLEGAQELSRVPNLIYRDGPAIIATAVQRIENLDALPAPSFEGLPLPLYFSPAPALPVYSSRGCYWGKCAFCNVIYSNGRFTVRDPAAVTADLAQLAKRYRCDFFYFVDEALPPHYLEQLADHILAAGLKIQWGILARFERKFDGKLCAKLAKAGCRVLTFGLESACDRVLERMNKGNESAVMREVLAACHQAGIINQLFFFIGFPTETLEEAKQTLKFIIHNSPHISALSFGQFQIMMGSEIERRPEEYQIEPIYPPEELDHTLWYNYVAQQGLTSQAAGATLKLFEQVLTEYGYVTIGNFHLIMMAAHHRTNNLLWITAAPKEKLFGKKRLLEKRRRRAGQTAALLFDDLTFLSQ